MTAIDTKSKSPISASPFGAIGMFQAVDDATDSLTRPAVTKAPVKTSRAVLDDEPLIGANAKRPAGAFDLANNGKEEKDDTSFAYTMLLFGQFANANADENGEMDSGAVTTIVDAMEKMGLDVAPLKKTLEEISGKSWADLSAKGDTTKFDVSGFYSEGPKGSRIPRMNNAGFDSLQAIRCANNDNAGSGYCAKGTANVLESMGYKVSRGHATDWDSTLPKNGWVKLNGVDPRNAPEGAVLVFDSDLQRGRPAHNNGGGKYGHVEIAVDGGFLSDKLRPNPGGSVPNNFAGAYMYVGPNAPPENRAIIDRINNPVAHHAPALIHS